MKLQLTEGRRRLIVGGELVAPFRRVGRARGKSLGSHIPRRYDKAYAYRRLMPHFREKFRQCDWVPVPYSDTGGGGEYPQALERTAVKELGKIGP